MNREEFLLDLNGMSDVDAERAIIEIIIDSLSSASSQRAIALSSLTASDFMDVQTRACFAVIEHLVASAHPVDHLAVSSELRQRKQPYQSADIRSSLLATKDNLEHYIAIVQRESSKRKIMMLARDAINQVPDANTPIAAMVGQYEEAIRKCMPRGVDDKASIGKLVEHAVIKLEERGRLGNRVTGISTGLDDLDWMTHGFDGSQLVVIGGRPGMGKTSLAMQIAVHAASSGTPALVSSLEMPASQLVDRMFSSMSRVPHHQIRSGYMTAESWEAVGANALKLIDMPIVIDDASVQTPADIRARATRMANTTGLGLIIVDHVQIVEPTFRTNNPVQDVGAVSRDLKNIANDFKVPVIVLAQLSRSLEHRADKRPLLSDLRDSGSIEQNADLVMFVYRDMYYKRDEYIAGSMEQAEIIIAKNRDGQTGSSVVGFWPEYMRFDNLDKRYE